MLEFGIGRFTVLFGKNNAGKTSILDCIYLMLASHAPGVGEARLRCDSSADSVDKQIGWSVGAVYVDLESDFEFDHAVLESFPHWEPPEDGVVRFGPLPPEQVCYGSVDRRRRELWFTDASEFYRGVYQEILSAPANRPPHYELDEQQRSDDGPFPKPLLLGGEVEEIDTWVTAAIAKLTAPDGWYGDELNAPLEYADWNENVYRLRPRVKRAVEQLASLATDLLPDFLDGEIRTTFSTPERWDDHPRVRLFYSSKGESAGSLRNFGRGASRWMGIAVQLALRIMEGDTETTSLDSVGAGKFSGHVLFIDEPEAHLHHSAVASIVRWCNRMVGRGFNVLAASHHEEFLRAPSEDVTFVNVARKVVDVDDAPTLSTTARTITTAATKELQELADEVGMHPAAALSLHRAILFVEGTLDEAVLEEYAGGRLDAAGVSIIPIHGTKNLEGLIDGEFTARLGIKTGVLTDNTKVATLWDRSNRKRSSEEVKLVRLIKRYEERGLPKPTLFGVAEDDLLFALPVEAIRVFLKGPFPEWRALIDECRALHGLGPSDSAPWKDYALEQYGLPITTPDGVRRVVRALDLAGVELASIRTVFDDIIDWAYDT
ncbi:AAA family ATPase [Mycolicibacterium sp. 050232]|uniref:AAA family ATPase n=1 Tax=Mycolicibacterium sp. 050232 TaxID=3113982 RepID=UPI002E2E06A9|nr:AAA family ATPase [Mycolicibacterium sp. 050232]MED5812893.1 AAA family ATPase [Mycolicibacterium sp. 050232]